ncbi:MAG: hypothetical protein Q7U53_08100 [Anaerolineaceae bacterium]|nr:hypothetical protein [Anaerolineaceae bacterium]
MEEFFEEELRRQILNFLKDFKELMGQGSYYVKGHLKNLNTLIELGITSRQRDELILSVALENYSSGPIQDVMHPGNYWVFGKKVNTKEIYIKLKIITFNNGTERAVCISFHPSEYPLKYPLRN